MTEEKIQALVDRGLLRPKAEVEWKVPTSEGFLMEDDKEQVIFRFFFERGFNAPIGDFFRGLLYYYKLELVHLVPNSIVVVSSFIHLYEVYMGMLPHFLLWQYFFLVKRTGKLSDVVNSVSFCFQLGRKLEFIDMELPKNNSGWKADWVYVADQKPTLPKRTGHKPMKIPEWDLTQTSCETEDLKCLLTIFTDLK
jgi:hypothetical protein